MDATPVVRVRGLVKHFPIRKGLLGRQVAAVRAVDGVDLDLAPGEALGLVGESGCGKTTLGRCLLRLIEPTQGSISLMGQDIMSLRGRALRTMRRHAQMIFQDPYGSLNPRMTVGQAIIEPMLVHQLYNKDQARQAALDMIHKVGLLPQHLDQYPHQFSGGQRQRIGIARALGLSPKLVVCDEPVSALDVSVQAQVLNLLRQLQNDLGVAYVFISHDLAVVSWLCSRIAVMYMGEIVELGSREAIYRHPLHPYTQALLSAIPDAQRQTGRPRVILQGDPPSPMLPSSAARFTGRFPRFAAAFLEGEIRLQEAGPGHWVRCAHVDRLRELAA